MHILSWGLGIGDCKRSDFLRFYLYLCHVIDDFACLELQH